MAGIFDIHVVMVLQSGWEVLRADAAAFKAMFQDEVLPTALLTEWHDKLVEDDLEIRAAWTLGPLQRPVVGVSLEEIPNDEQPLGYVADIGDDGEIIHGMIIDQVAAVRCWAPTPELTRALRVVLRGLLMDAVDWFSGVGYADVMYMGGGDLRPEEALIPEELGTWVQMQRWRAIGEARTGAGAVVVQKPVLVAADDVTVGGHQGGVTPITT